MEEAVIATASFFALYEGLTIRHYVKSSFRVTPRLWSYRISVCLFFRLVERYQRGRKNRILVHGKSLLRRCGGNHVEECVQRNTHGGSGGLLQWRREGKRR